MILNAVERRKNGVKSLRMTRDGLSGQRTAANVASKVTSGDPVVHRAIYTRRELKKTYPM